MHASRRKVMSPIYMGGGGERTFVHEKCMFIFICAVTHALGSTKVPTQGWEPQVSIGECAAGKEMPKNVPRRWTGSRATSLRRQRQPKRTIATVVGAYNSHAGTAVQPLRLAPQRCRQLVVLSGVILQLDAGQHGGGCLVRHERTRLWRCRRQYC